MRIEKLATTHKRSTFRCGRDDLDQCLHTAAMQAQQRSRSARTTVLVAGDTVIGSYAPATHAVAFPAAPQQLVRGIPRYDAVPAVRLARLAIHEDHQGRGLGLQLLAAAVRDVLAAAEHVGIVLMTVDAIGEAAAAFHAYFGSVRLDVDRPRPALAARIKDLQATFDASPRGVHELAREGWREGGRCDARNPRAGASPVSGCTCCRMQALAHPVEAGAPGAGWPARLRGVAVASCAAAS